MVEAAKLEEVLTAWMLRHQTPGLAVALVQDHRLVLQRGFGQTSVGEGGLPVTETTLFRIASTTKMLVGTAVMRLVEQGLLMLDAPLSVYLPWLHLSQPGAEDLITLRHLLSHTSGLCHFPADFTSRDPDGLEVWAHEYLPAYPILFPPGQVWLYSNTGLALAAYVAQVVTATSFAPLMQELLFDPLGMMHTTLDPLVALTYPCALGHRRSESGWEIDHQFVQNTVWDPAGGALSSVHDLMQVAWLYLQEGIIGKRHLLSAETIQLMQTPQVRCWTRQEEGYGLTWATAQYRGVPLVRHNGGGVSSFQSAFVLVPTQGLALLLLTNGGPLGKLVPQLLDELLVVPAEAPKPIFPPDQANWPGYCGTYLGLYTGLVEVGVADQRLCLTRNGKRFVLEAHCQQHYLGQATDGNEEISVGFPQATGGVPPGWIVVDDAPCERLASRPVFSPEPGRWTRFVGRYELPGGALIAVRTLSVALERQTLVLTYGTRRMSCLPITSTTFACDVGVIDFLETADGHLLEFQRTMRARPVPD